MRNFTASLALSVATLFTAMNTSAADTKADAAQSTISYLRLYADSNGVSHFKEEKLPFTSARENGPLRHALMDKTGAAFLRLKSGAKEDWHRAPQRWFLIAVQGISEVTASDGEVRRLTPGTIMLMDDTTGKGHITRAIGPEDHVAIVIPVTDVASAK